MGRGTRQFAAMGKVAVRLKEVVYMVSPFEVSIRITPTLQLVACPSR